MQFPVILAIIYLTTFSLAWIAPGDPFSALSEKNSPERVAALKAQYNVDNSWNFLTTYPLRMVQGDFGPSFSKPGQDVGTIIGDALPISIAIGTLAIIIATILGVLIGTFAAVRRGGAVDFGSLTIALMGVSVPSFVVATGLLGAFAYKSATPLYVLLIVLLVGAFALALFKVRRDSLGRYLGINAAVLALLAGAFLVVHWWLIDDLIGLFPAGGWPGTMGRGYDNPQAYLDLDPAQRVLTPSGSGSVVTTWNLSFGESVAAWCLASLDYLKHMILPAAALSLLPMAYITRLTRVSMIDVLGSDYVRTARAKGLSRFKVVFKHCLRNAFLPVLSFLGPAAANVLVGSFIVERIFALPGLGTHFIESVQFRDQTLILGTVMIYSILLLTLNLVVDVMYGVVDPRISVGGAH